MTAVATLRSLLVERFPDAVTLPERSLPPIPTGLPSFDRILPNGGLPRGRVVVWQTETGGATALLSAAAREVVTRGERVAWIDGQRSAGSWWAGGEGGPLVIRPSSPALARKAAEILLRSGGFGLVVAGGLEADGSTMLRLSRMVHEGGGGFVALTPIALTASVRITSRYLPSAFRTAAGPFGAASVRSAALRVEVRSPGWHSHADFHLPVVAHDLRLALVPDLADRRGQLD